MTQTVTEQEVNKLKLKAAVVSVSITGILTVFKLLASLMTGSVSVLSEALHSSSDLVITSLMFTLIKISTSPADEKHRYGHGKFEDLSGAIEGSLIMLVGLFIIYEAVNRIILGDLSPVKIDFALLVMGISALISLVTSEYIKSVSYCTDSVALRADSVHLRADFYICAGVFSGLLIVNFTNIQLIDIIAALIVAFVIIKGGYSVLTLSLAKLMDSALPPQDEKIIYTMIEQHVPSVVSAHSLKTRKSGSTAIIEFHLTLSAHMSIEEGHKLCDMIENELENHFKNAHVTIHVEPCLDICRECHVYEESPETCYRYQQKIKDNVPI